MHTTYISPVMVDGGCRGSSYEPKEHKQNVEDVVNRLLDKMTDLTMKKFAKYGIG